MSDPTPAATARDALLALHDFLWDEMEWFSDESAPMPRYTTMAHGQKHDDLVERFHDAYPELLAAAEATPSEPVARCGFTTDGFRCNDTPLQHRYLCGLLHSHTFVCHPFTPGARDE